MPASPSIFAAAPARVPAWDDARAAALDPVDRLVYRSNLLGATPGITNTGGGNTSAKVPMPDPLTGDSRPVLWVKGSGGDLRTATRANFASLHLDDLERLKGVYARGPSRGVKSPGEDALVALYPHATFGLNPCAPSIDTPLHAFVPSRHADHTHPNAVIALAAARRGRELTAEVFGPDVGWLDWQRPGFELGLALERACRASPGMKGVVLGKHGLMNWADGDRACFELTLSLVARASAYIAARDKGDATFGGPACAPLPDDARDALLADLLPWLRGRVSERSRMIATIHASPEVLRFVCARDAARLAAMGTSCPDHFLRTKITPLFVEWDPRQDAASLERALDAGLARYRRDYAAYYDRCRRPDSPPMRDPNPTVVLIPGVGMVALGKSKSESRVTAEFYACAVEVMRGAEAIDEYTALDEQEAFDIEYWSLEEAKLRRMPPENALARRVAVVVGGGGGIGRAAALRLAAEGAHAVCADASEQAAQSAAAEIESRAGPGIGLGGTGVSACGPALGLHVDVTDRASVRAMLREVVLAFGGLDDVVVTAGVYVPSGPEGNVTDAQFRAILDVNVRGPVVVAEEARRVWDRQALPGTLVITTSVNAVVPKAGSLAYDASKAAANHVVRELAVTLAPRVRVNGVAPATVVDGSSMFPRDRVVASLTRYGLPWREDEPDEVLRARLAEFYAQRTLLKRLVRPEDQAEAVLFLVSDRSSRTTGQVLTVDGGLSDAFLR